MGLIFVLVLVPCKVLLLFFHYTNVSSTIVVLQAETVYSEPDNINIVSLS